MGFLEVGVPMEWEDTPEYYQILDYVKQHGALQFLEVFKAVKERRNDMLKWGDEVEFHVFQVAMENGVEGSESDMVQLYCQSADLIKFLQEEDRVLKENGKDILSTWHPEYGAWMIEATPSEPYGKYAADLRKLEHSLRYRRFRIQRALNYISCLNDSRKKLKLSNLAVWPRMGCKDFVEGSEELFGNVSRSRYLPDKIINPHPRFATLTRNIRKRRGKKVDIRVPVYSDVGTNISALNKDLSTALQNEPNEVDRKSAEEIYMDSMGFGMGCCCLQVTFQARDLDESRYLYDQLAVLCPIFLSLSAASPFFKGFLADTDVRWNTIVQSVDCRTDFERNVQPDKVVGSQSNGDTHRGIQKIKKSRYDSIDLYISQTRLLKDEYNDTNAELDELTLKVLEENNVDSRLAKHISHLFIRDPLVIFSDRIYVDDKKTTEHFENIQSTNWQTMRWKPPPLNSIEKDQIGWRVEFRPMEMQLTDFENAAYTIAIVLLTRVILFFDLNLYIPLSKVDANMKTAHKKNSVLESEFYFRRNLIPLEEKCKDESSINQTDSAGNPPIISQEFKLMKISEILCGKLSDNPEEEFPGLFPLVYAYLEIIDCDSETYSMVEKYLNFLSQRAEGKVMTTASYLRNYITSHPDYKKDSKISKKLEKDLVLHCDQISNGFVSAEKLLGKVKIRPLVLDNTCDTEREESAEDLSSASENIIMQRFNSYVLDDNLNWAADSTSPGSEIQNQIGEISRPTSNLSNMKRLRGSSFAADLDKINGHAKKQFECGIIKDLIKKYKSKSVQEHILDEQLGFFDTPAFFNQDFSA